MFTGIIKEIGSVINVRHYPDIITIEISCPLLRPILNPGDSVAIDGCDLTVTNLNPTSFTADITLETLNITTLGNLRSGSRVNLEPSLTPSTPISGHFVLGHIDGIGTVKKFAIKNNQAELRIEPPKELLKFIAIKGSITVSGVGLTVVESTSSDFSCWIVPYTLEHTTLGEIKPGDKVNLEVDVLAKYIIHALESKSSSSSESRINLEFLKEHGFA